MVQCSLVNFSVLQVIVAKSNLVQRNVVMSFAVQDARFVP